MANALVAMASNLPAMALVREAVAIVGLLWRCRKLPLWAAVSGGDPARIWSCHDA